MKAGSWLIFIVIIVGLSLAGWTSSGQNKAQRIVWEYRTFEGKANDVQLNQLSSEGWELVTVVADNNQMSYYFKRAK